MTRTSKQEERRAVSRRRPRRPSTKTGPKKDQLPLGFKEHANVLESEHANNCFIPKIR